MPIRRIAVVFAVLLIAGIVGCAGTPNLDRNWGRSFEAAKYNQTLNPEADTPSAPRW